MHAWTFSGNLGPWTVLLSTTLSSFRRTGGTHTGCWGILGLGAKKTDVSGSLTLLRVHEAAASGFLIPPSKVKYTPLGYPAFCISLLWLFQLALFWNLRDGWQMNRWSELFIVFFSFLRLKRLLTRCMKSLPRKAQWVEMMGFFLLSWSPSIWERGKTFSFIPETSKVLEGIFWRE